MRLFKASKTKNSKTSPQKLTSRMSVMQYYRSSNGSSSYGKRREKINDVDIRKNEITYRNAKNLLTSFVQSLPGIVIIVLLIANLGLSSISVSIEDIVIPVENSELFRSKSEYMRILKEMQNESLQNSTKITFRSEQFEQKIISRFPEITNASAIVPLFGRDLYIKLSLATPLMRIIAPNNQRGIMSDSGRIIDLSSNSVAAENLDALPSIALIPQIDMVAGSQLLTKQELVLIELLINEFDGSEGHRFKIDSIQFDVSKREIRVSFKNQKFYAKLTPEVDAKEQVGALLAVLSRLDSTKHLPDKYIDVRVQERVFVL